MDTSFQAVPVNVRGVAHRVHTVLILTTQSGAGFLAQPGPPQKRQHPTTCLSACGANGHSVTQKWHGTACLSLCLVHSHMAVTTPSHYLPFGWWGCHFHNKRLHPTTYPSASGVKSHRHPPTLPPPLSPTPLSAF